MDRTKLGLICRLLGRGRPTRDCRKALLAQFLRSKSKGLLTEKSPSYIVISEGMTRPFLAQAYTTNHQPVTVQDIQTSRAYLGKFHQSHTHVLIATGLPIPCHQKVSNFSFHGIPLVVTIIFFSDTKVSTLRRSLKVWNS